MMCLRPQQAPNVQRREAPTVPGSGGNGPGARRARPAGPGPGPCRILLPEPVVVVTACFGSPQGGVTPTRLVLDSRCGVRLSRPACCPSSDGAPPSYSPRRSTPGLVRTGCRGCSSTPPGWCPEAAGPHPGRRLGRRSATGLDTATSQLLDHLLLFICSTLGMPCWRAIRATSPVFISSRFCGREDEDLPDQPVELAQKSLVGVHDHPRTHELLRRIRAVLDSYPESGRWWAK
jgi:hypothetical protein